MSKSIFNRGHLLTIASLLSLLLGAGSVVFWILSYRTYHTLAHWECGGGPSLGGDDCQIVSSQGRVQYRLSTVVNSGQWPNWWKPGTRPIRVSAHWFGGSEYKLDVILDWSGQGPATTLIGRTIWVPHWLVVLAAAILPCLWVATIMRGRRIEGHCRCCGYDLTGNISGKCPECGRETCPPSEKGQPPRTPC